MKTPLKMAWLVGLSLIITTGCATERTQNGASRPVNLLGARANTHPAMRNGINENYDQDKIIGMPPAVIVEPAGSDRLQKVE